MACHHHLWAAHTVELRRALHACIALRQHTQSKDIGRGMTSPSFDSTHGRTTSRVTCHPRLWTAHTVERHKAWHAIIAYRRQTRSNDIRRDMTYFGQHTRSNDVGSDMPSPPLDSTHGRTTLGMACHHQLWAAQTVERHLAWHAIIVLGSKHGRMTSGVTCHHHL